MTVEQSDYINNCVFTLEKQGQGRIVGIVTRLQARRTGIQIPVGGDCLISKHGQTGSGAHPVSPSVGTTVLSWGQSGRNVTTSHLCVSPRLTLSGAIPLLPFPSWYVWNNFTFTLEMQVKNSFAWND